MPPGLHVQHTHLPRAPLVLVVCEVRFQSVFRIADKVFVAAFQDAIRARYPTVGQEHEFQMTVGPDGLQQSPSTSKKWKFAEPAGVWTLSLSDAAMSIETRRYSDASEFLERLKEALEALHQHVHPGQLDRIGLRYINEIHHPDVTSPTDWKGLVRDHFLGPIAADVVAGRRIDRTIQEIVVAPQQGHQLTIRHGHQPEGSTVLPAPGTPAASTGPFYLFDFDHSVTGPNPLVPTSVAGLVDEFHSTNYDLFKSAITPKLWSYLEVAE